MNIFLDIDGVILANDKNGAKYVHEFLQHITSKYPDNTYWLTTHVHGNAETAVERLKLVLEPRTIDLLHNIKATDWDIAKTEAIDFSQPFLWFDDDLYPDEREDLVKHNALSSWIEVDLAKNENHLKVLSDKWLLPTVD